MRRQLSQLRPSSCPRRCGAAIAVGAPASARAAQRRPPPVLCRYDTRQSAANVAERRRRRKPKRSLQTHLLEAAEFAEARSSMVVQRAKALSAATTGQLSLTLCLALLTQQQQLLAIPTRHIAGRVLSLADALGLRPADVGQLLLTNGALLDVLPLRLCSAADGLASALGLSRADALAMLAGDPNLLDTPPLRVRQFLEAAAAALAAHGGDAEQQQQQQQWAALLYGMAAACPALLTVDADALVSRVHRLAALLGAQTPALQALLAAEPRLLMSSGQALADNHAAIRGALGLDAAGLARWLAAAPLLLAVPAAQLQQRLAALERALRFAGRALLQRHERQRRRARRGAADGSDDDEAAEGGSGSSSDDEELDEDEVEQQERWLWQQEAEQQAHTKQQALCAAALSSSAGEPGDRAADSQAQGASDAAANGTRSAAAAGDDGGDGVTGLRWRCVAADRAQLLAWVAKDPRVLLLSASEARSRVGVLGVELGLSRRWADAPHGFSSLAAALALGHPSYLAAEPGLLQAWMDDVRHLTGLSAMRARRLAACPQVFLTLGPEDVSAAFAALAAALTAPQHDQLPLPLPPDAAAAAVAEEPLLLVQAPATTVAALAALAAAVQDPRLRAALLAAAPELLLQGARAGQALQALAGVLSLSCSQLAVLLVRQPGFWGAVVPRHTWPCCPPWPSQQRQESGAAALPPSPAAATAAATMAALQRCGLRPPDVMQAAAVLHPSLLWLGPAAALGHVAALAARCERSGRWREQLRSELTPDQLGAALLRAHTWDARLAFLIASGLPDAVSLGEVTGLSLADFKLSFGPQFEAWTQRRGAAGWRAPGHGLQREQPRAWRPPPPPPGDEVDGFVAALQARLATGAAADHPGVGAATATVASAAASASDGWEQQQLEQQQLLRQDWQDEGPLQPLPAEQEGDDGSDAGTDAGAPLAGGPPQEPWLEQQQPQHAAAAAAAARDGSGGTTAHGGRRAVWQPLLTRHAQLLESVQLSGWEMYGTWRGCLLQPEDVAGSEAECRARDE